MAHATSTKYWLWHQPLSHLNFDTINDLAKNDIVFGLPKCKYLKEHLYQSYEQGKSKRASHPPKPVPNSKQRLHLLHMDLCGPMRVKSINGKRKPDISFIHVFGAPVIPRMILKILGSLVQKVILAFSLVILLIPVLPDLKPRLQSTTSGQISLGLDLTYAPSTIKTQQPTERELDLLFEAMYDDYIGGQPSATPRTTPASPAPQVL
ncbi:integrase, catalytic region, zinc finger, CCHC-type containing protein [Tanacetum coccineum]